MLAKATVVPTDAVTDLDRAKRFSKDRRRLPMLDETRFSFRWGAGKGTQIGVRRVQLKPGQTVGHFESTTSRPSSAT